MMVMKSSPRIRELVVECRSRAIRGDQESALIRLDNALSYIVADSTLDRLVVLMAKIEILHLDCREEESLQVFTGEVDTIIGNVSEDIGLAVSYNRSDVAVALWKPDDFYGVVDRSRIANVELWDYRAFYEVAQAAEAGKHYDSLPAVWAELLRTYRQGCWRPYRAASRLMAIECLQLGWPHEAVYHAIIAGQDETAKQVGQFLLVNGTSEILEKSIDVLLDCAHLQRHFATGCEIMMPLVDAIPESRIEGVANWLIAGASAVPRVRTSRRAFEYAWEGLVALSPRLSKEQAEEVFALATNHPIWHAVKENERKVITVRDDMIRAITRCVQQLPLTLLDDVVEKCLPLALERKQDHDYTEVVELLCRLAQVGGRVVATKIREHLYPKGQRLNWVLLQVAPIFDVELKDTAALAKDASAVAENIRLQVQRLPFDQKMKDVNGSGAYTTIDLGEQKIYIHMANAMDLEAIVRHRHKLPESALRLVIDAVVDMVLEPENSISNKAGLIGTLDDIGDVCSDETASTLFRVLLPFARGQIVEPTHMMSAAQAANPLNPIKMGSGQPVELRGIALYVLACLERDKPGIFKEGLDQLIAQALTDIDHQVRSWAFAAAREKPTLSEIEFTALILGTRDHHAEAAETAFRAVANKRELKLKRPQWRLLIHSAQLARQTRAVKLRRAAAYACAQLIGLAPRGVLKDSLSELCESFQHDTCFSVRRAAMLINDED